VREHGQGLSFPFELTKRRIFGKFRHPPNANGTTVPENELQEFFIRECMELGSLDSIKLIVHDTHSTPLLDTRKPDFVFIRKGWPLDSLNVAVVGVIRQQSSSGFSNEDVGHAISFGEKVLQIQPRRTYIYVLLTDCIDICIFRVTRLNNNTNNDNIRFSYEITPPQTLMFTSKNSPPLGWKYLVTIMECTLNDLGWVESSLNFGRHTVNLVRSINTGRTSVVYKGKVNDSNHVVVKLAKEGKYLSCFTTEKNVLGELSAMNSPHLQKLLLENEGALVTTPLGSKINHLQKKDIRDIIKTLETVHSTYNRVHMDLRRNNFLRGDDGQILIIDWGYSVAKDGTGNFAGALEVMPDDILTSLINGEQIKYSPKIDLICFVRTFYSMCHKPTNAEIERLPLNGPSDIKSQARNILNFWSDHGKSNLWKKIHQQASELKYDNLIEELEALF
jgi:hypothetical protein